MEDFYGFEQFKRKVLKNKGINLYPYRDYETLTLLLELVKPYKIYNFKQFYDRMIEDESLVDLLKNNLTFHGGDFFREGDWDYLEHEIIPYLMDNFGKIKIWNPACSTGKEAISLIAILEKLKIPKDKYSFLCTDIHQESLDKFKNKEHFKTIKKINTKLEYFTPLFDSNGNFKNELLNNVIIQQHDLTSDFYPDEKFNMIMCRNAIKFFNEKTAHMVQQKLLDKLENGGILFIGLDPRESIINIDNVKQLVPTIYKKF